MIIVSSHEEAQRVQFNPYHQTQSITSHEETQLLAILAILEYILLPPSTEHINPSSL